MKRTAKRAPRSRSGRLVAIDPGVTLGCAWALFDAGALVDHGFFEGTLPDLAGVTLVVWECPEYQGARSANARIQDTIALTAAGGVCAGMFAGATGAALEAWPVSRWKGSKAKPITHATLWSALDPVERELLGGDATGFAITEALEKGAMSRWKPGRQWYKKSFTMHNILDAVAIGAVVLGRVDFGR